jgi:hypothetical protein
MKFKQQTWDNLVERTLQEAPDTVPVDIDKVAPPPGAAGAPPAGGMEVSTPASGEGEGEGGPESNVDIVAAAIQNGEVTVEGVKTIMRGEHSALPEDDNKKLQEDWQEIEGWLVDGNPPEEACEVDGEGEGEGEEEKEEFKVGGKYTFEKASGERVNGTLLKINDNGTGRFKPDPGQLTGGGGGFDIDLNKLTWCPEDDCRDELTFQDSYNPLQDRKFSGQRWFTPSSTNTKSYLDLMDA